VQGRSFLGLISLCICSAAPAVLPGEEEEEVACCNGLCSALTLVWQRVTYVNASTGKHQTGNLSHQASAQTDG